MTITPDRETRFIDKSTWGDGPWLTEPDKVQWQDEATGLACLAVRHRSSGHWCGYVGVAEGHPAFALSYDDAGDLAEPDEEGYRYLRVHGGLTFSGFCEEAESEEGRAVVEEQGICHVARPGQPERVWWLGFDAAHSLDLAPGTEAILRSYKPSLASPPPLALGGRLLGGYLGVTYRTLDYIQAECAHLAQQLVEVAQRRRDQGAAEA